MENKNKNQVVLLIVIINITMSSGHQDAVYAHDNTHQKGFPSSAPSLLPVEAALSDLSSI